MTHLTPQETDLLRRTLGLSKWNKHTLERNFIFKALAEDVAIIDALVERGYMKEKFIASQAKEPYYIATPAGVEAVRDQRWQD